MCCGNRSVCTVVVVVVGDYDSGLLLLLRYGRKLGHLSRLVQDGLERLDGLKHREGLRLRGWWRVVRRRDENQAGLAAVVGGALQQEEVLGLGRRWWRRRWRCWRRG